MTPKIGFHLVKWYLDCVSDAGEVIIGYAASLRWGALRQGSSSVLVLVEGSAVERRTRRHYLPPTSGDETIRWRPSGLRLAGTWTALSPPVELVLPSNSGPVQWSCLMPRARAEVQLGDGRRLAGLAYIERLSLTVPPWQLGLTELRWGRFLSPMDAVVWIDWKGTQDRRVVFDNGIAASNARFGPDGLSFGDSVLELRGTRPIHVESMLDAALAAVGRLRRRLPRTILQMRDQKYLSTGRLQHASGASEGWALHETVYFEPVPDRAP